MADKQTKLSIVLRAVDNATAKIKAIGDRLDAITKPTRDFGKALSDLRESSGLDKVIGGFQGVGSAIAGVLAKVAVIGGAVGVAVAGLFKLVEGFDDLGDKAEALGVSVDFLAQMRFAAERSGASVESLDSGLKAFSQSLGQARAGTGRMAAFLEQVSPALLRQVKAAKSNQEAFDLMANAMAKIEDPAKRAALAQKVFGDSALAPLLGKGAAGIKQLRDRYLELAGSQEDAAKEAGAVDDSLKDFKATTDGIKAALVSGLAPALKVIVDQLSGWFKDNRGRVAEFAANLGKKLPAAFDALVGAVKSAIGFVKPFVDSTTKLKIIAGVLAGVILGPLISSVYALGVAILTTPVGWIVGGIALITAGAIALIKNWDSVAGFFVDLWDTVKGAFSAFFGWVADVFMTYTPLGAIVAAWEPISGFFVSLWDGITGVFQTAWAVIKTIVDGIVGAVETVTGAVGSVIDVINPFSTVDEKPASFDESVGKVFADLQALQSTSQAKVTVDFANAPRGTRVTADPKNTADLDLSTGYQLNPGGV